MGLHRAGLVEVRGAILPGLRNLAPRVEDGGLDFGRGGGYLLRHRGVLGEEHFRVKVAEGVAPGRVDGVVEVEWVARRDGEAPDVVSELVDLADSVERLIQALGIRPDLAGKGPACTGSGRPGDGKLVVGPGIGPAFVERVKMLWFVGVRDAELGEPVEEGLMSSLKDVIELLGTIYRLPELSLECHRGRMTEKSLGITYNGLQSHTDIRGVIARIIATDIGLAVSSKVSSHALPERLIAHFSRCLDFDSGRCHLHVGEESNNDCDIMVSKPQQRW